MSFVPINPRDLRKKLSEIVKDCELEDDFAPLRLYCNEIKLEELVLTSFFTYVTFLNIYKKELGTWFLNYKEKKLDPFISRGTPFKIKMEGQMRVNEQTIQDKKS
jgi:hypothetical protein